MSKKIFIFLFSVCHILLGDEVSDFLANGRIYGHVGGYYQYMSGGRANFADVNASLGYRSPVSYKKWSFGGSIWLAGRLYEYTRGDFKTSKRTILLTELYVRNGNETTPIRTQFGRFKMDAEWIKHYNQGIHADISVTPYVTAELAWVNANAYVTNYRMSDYRNPYGYYGAFYGVMHLNLPQSIIKLHPYFYYAPGRFVSFGVQGLINRPLVGESSFFGKVHLLSYIGSDNQMVERLPTDGDSAFIWLEGGLQLVSMKFGGGFISVSKRGVAGIDSFGQSSYFERREGLFYANALTLYGFVEYTFQNQVTLESAIRISTASGRQVFNWEANAKFMLDDDLQVGGGLIGMLNETGITLDDNIFASDGRSYLLGRVFIQYSF